MAGKNGRSPDPGDQDDELDALDKPADEDREEDEYGEMMLLEQLESLEEEMMELGVTSLDEVRQRIRDLHADMGGD